MTSLLDTPPATRNALSRNSHPHVRAGRGLRRSDLTGERRSADRFPPKEETVPGEEGGEHVTYVDMAPWLILSHVAGRRIGLVVDGKLSDQRVDPFILINLAACPMPLRGVVGDIEMNGLPVH